MAAKAGPAQTPKDEEALAGMMEMIRKTPRIPISIDLHKMRHVISGHGHGGGDSEDNVSIIINGIAGTHGYPLAVISFDPQSWNTFKKVGDDFFRSMARAARRKKK